MMKRTFLAFLLFVFTLPAAGEIEKLAIPGDRGMQFYWWPKLAPLEGWQQDREFSLAYSVNALAPTGQSFADAETVMYAKATYKPRVPDTKSLEAMIANDRKDFLFKAPGIIIADAPPLQTADGKTLVSLTFTPNGKGNWERVAYLEEGEFYIAFTVSSRTAAGYQSAAKSYEMLIGGYREHGCTWHGPSGDLVFSPAKSKVLSSKLVSSLANQWSQGEGNTRVAQAEIALRDLVQKLGPPVRDVGSGLFILEWNMADGRVLRASAGGACDVPVGVSKVRLKRGA